MNTPPTLVDTKTAAAALGVSIATLKKDRAGRKTVPFFRIAGSCRYDIAEVRAALAQRGATA